MRTLHHSAAPLALTSGKRSRSQRVPDTGVDATTGGEGGADRPRSKRPRHVPPSTPSAVAGSATTPSSANQPPSTSASSRSSDHGSSSQLRKARSALKVIRSKLPEWNKHVASDGSHRSFATVTGDHGGDGRFFSDYSPIASLLAGCPQRGLFYEAPLRGSDRDDPPPWNEDEIVLEFTRGRWVLDVKDPSEYVHRPDTNVYRLTSHGFGQDKVVEMLAKAKSCLFFDSASDCLANRANFVHGGVRPDAPFPDVKIGFTDVGKPDDDVLPAQAGFPHLMLTARGATRLRSAVHGSPVELFIGWRMGYSTDTLFKHTPSSRECARRVEAVNAAIKAKELPWTAVKSIRCMADICDWVDSTIAADGLRQTIAYHSDHNRFNTPCIDMDQTSVGHLLTEFRPIVMSLESTEALLALWNFRRATFSAVFPARETWDTVFASDGGADSSGGHCLRRLVLSRCLPHTLWHVHDSPATGDDPGRTCLPASNLSCDMKQDLRVIIKEVQRQTGVTAGVVEVELLSGPDIGAVGDDIKFRTHIDGVGNTVYLNIGILLDYATAADRDKDRKVPRMTSLSKPGWVKDPESVSSFPYDIETSTMTTCYVGCTELRLPRNPHLVPHYLTYDAVAKEFERHKDENGDSLPWDRKRECPVGPNGQRLDEVEVDRDARYNYCHFGQFWVFNGSVPHRSPHKKDLLDWDNRSYKSINTSERRWLFLTFHFTGIPKPESQSFQEFVKGIHFSDQAQCTHLLDLEERVRERRQSRVANTVSDGLPAWTKHTNLSDVVGEFWLDNAAAKDMRDAPTVTQHDQ